MNRFQEALLFSCVLLAFAALAVFGIVPQAVAQYAPLAVVPFMMSRQPACRSFGKGQQA